LHGREDHFFNPGKFGAENDRNKVNKGSILVPFPVESVISGVVEHISEWYRRKLTAPETGGTRHLESGDFYLAIGNQK